ncbi:MAG: PAS domain S-box protein [Deltaproteobacteria bacterium]
MKKPFDPSGRDIALLQDRLRREEHLMQSLCESMDIYKTVWDHALAGIYVSQGGKFRMINPIALSFMSYQSEELVGKKSICVIYPDDRKMARKNAIDMLAGVRTAPYEFRIVTKQGKICWVMETVTSTTFKGKPAILGNTRDITPRKTAGEKLQESENIYRAIFETTGTATIIIEADKTISLLNSEFEKMTGYGRAEWEGKKKWTEYVAPKDLARLGKYHTLRRLDPAAPPRNYEHDIIDAEGRIRHVFLTVDMIPGTKKSVASFTDITGWKKAEQVLKKREEELQIKSRSLKELNTTLRVLLKEREGDREELEEKVLSNVKAFVMPYMNKLKKSRMNSKATAYVDIMKSNLLDIISPFSRKISSKYRNLTPKEIQIANFIKEGKTSKEIAELMNVSKSAVDIHRWRLRNKLGLNKTKANLRSHLGSLA